MSWEGAGVWGGGVREPSGGWVEEKLHAGRRVRSGRRRSRWRGAGEAVGWPGGGRGGGGGVSTWVDPQVGEVWGRRNVAPASAGAESGCGGTGEAQAGDAHACEPAAWGPQSHRQSTSPGELAQVGRVLGRVRWEPAVFEHAPSGRSCVDGGHVGDFCYLLSGNFLYGRAAWGARRPVGSF